MARVQGCAPHPWACFDDWGGPQVDGGDTFTEPSVIMTGRPERQEDVVVRVHDACFTSGSHPHTSPNIYSVN